MLNQNKSIPQYLRMLQYIYNAQNYNFFFIIYISHLTIPVLQFESQVLRLFLNTTQN